MTDTINPQDRLDFIKREDMTPEQQAVFDEIAEITAQISKMLDGKRIDYCMAALLNNIGGDLHALHDSGQVDLLMRMAVGLETAAQIAAGMVKQLQAAPQH